MWVGDIIMGWNETQAISVVFDTASDWLIIPGMNCTDCEGRYYPGEYHSIPLTN